MLDCIKKQKKKKTQNETNHQMCCRNLLKVVTAVLQLNINKALWREGWWCSACSQADWGGTEQPRPQHLQRHPEAGGSCSPARRWGPWASRSSPGPLGAPAGTCHWRRPRGQAGRQREQGEFASTEKISHFFQTHVSESCSHPGTGAVGMKVMRPSRLHPLLPQRRQRPYFLWDEAVTWGQSICVAPPPTRTHAHSPTLQDRTSSIKLKVGKKINKNILFSFFISLTCELW